jgi:membrane protein DedA with SNARE-associated domain
MADWIIETITATGYWGIFLLMLLESVFPPIPSELIVPFAGFSAQRGDLNLFGVLAATTAGAVIGMLPWYIAARLLGLQRTKWLADRIGRWVAMNSDEIDVASDWFLRFGPIIVFAGRLVPLIRTVISVPAGIAAMPVAAFLAASTLGALLWNSILIGAGYILSSHYHLVETVIDPATIIVLVLCVLIYLWRVVTWKPGLPP